MKQLMTLPAVLMLVAMCSNPVTHHSVSKVDFAPIALGNTWVYACSDEICCPCVSSIGLKTMTIITVDSMKDRIVFEVKIRDSLLSEMTDCDTVIYDSLTSDTSYTDTLVKFYDVDTIKNLQGEYPPSGVNYASSGVYFGLTTIPPKDTLVTDTITKYNNLIECVLPGYMYWDLTQTYLQNVGITYYAWQLCPMNASVSGGYHAVLLTFNGKTPEQISKE